MKILMISLDKNILDPQSSAAGRMFQYGHHDDVFVIIPAKEEKRFDLKPSLTHILSTGGNSKFVQLFRILKLGRQIIKEAGIEEITTQDPFLTGLAGILLRRGFKKSGDKRIILEIQVHGDFFSFRYYYGWRIWLGRWVIRHADKIRVVGERVKKSLLDLNIDERIIRIKSVQAVLTQDNTFTPKLDVHEKYGHNKKIFLSIGRLEKVKNLFWLIDVFGQASVKKNEMLLLIVGSGAEEDALREKVKILGLTDQIKFESWTENPLSYIKTADCLVISSLSEGYGLTAMEAFTLGTPVIMNDVGVAGYELKPSSKVNIVSIGDKERFVQAMLSL